jgi:hypothetical protein
VGVAAFAALVGLIALFVSIAAHQAAGPRVRVGAVYGPTGPGGAKVLTVTVQNEGRGDITVDLVGVRYLLGNLYMTPVDPTAMSRRAPKLRRNLHWNGPALPYRLKGNDNMFWEQDLDNVIYDLNRDLTLEDRAAVLVRLGSRQRYVTVRFIRWHVEFETFPMPK